MYAYLCLVRLSCYTRTHNIHTNIYSVLYIIHRYYIQTYVVVIPIAADQNNCLKCV